MREVEKVTFISGQIENIKEIVSEGRLFIDLDKKNELVVLDGCAKNALEALCAQIVVHITHGYGEKEDPFDLADEILADTIQYVDGAIEKSRETELTDANAALYEDFEDQILYMVQNKKASLFNSHKFFSTFGAKDIYGVKEHKKLLQRKDILHQYEELQNYVPRRGEYAWESEKIESLYKSIMQ